jgi:hypothetical protein
MYFFEEEGFTCGQAQIAGGGLIRYQHMRLDTAEPVMNDAGAMYRKLEVRVESQAGLCTSDTLINCHPERSSG